MSKQTDTARLIPDDLARELCEALNLWDQGDYGIDTDKLVRDQIAPVIAEHMNPAPLRDCCDSRMGRRHVNCSALTAALTDVAEDIEWAASKQADANVALGYTAAAGRIRERLEETE